MSLLEGISKDHGTLLGSIGSTNSPGSWSTGTYGNYHSSPLKIDVAQILQVSHFSRGFGCFFLRELYLTSDMEGRAENSAMNETATVGLSLYSSCNMVDGRNSCTSLMEEILHQLTYLCISYIYTQNLTVYSPTSSLGYFFTTATGAGCHQQDHISVNSSETFQTPVGYVDCPHNR